VKLYAAILRLSVTQDRAVIIKAANLSRALTKIDSMRGQLICLAPVVSDKAYLEAIENGRREG
jgi:hypothetical protein